MALSGLEAEVRALISGSEAAGAGAGAENPVDLFADDLPSPILVEAERRGAHQARGPGRPAGARNRSSDDVVRYLQATRRSPLLALQDVVDMPVGDICTTFRLKPAEAVDFWRKCVAELLPYVARRQPQQLELPPGAAAMPVLALVSMPVEPRLAQGNPPAAGDGAIPVVEYRESERYQALVPEPIEPVTRAPSHADE